MLAAPRAADRTGSSAQVSYVRPHRLSRARSCTGAKSHTQPVARSAFPVAAPPASVADGSHVAPIPIDCGYNGACQGCPKPCTASTPKINGMCRREFMIQKYAIENSRLHIPLIFGVDAVHGFGHPWQAPLYPQSIGMGATWDPSSAQAGGTAVAN